MVRFHGPVPVFAVEMDQQCELLLAYTKKVKIERPPVPMTKLPDNPCKDKNAGAPGAAAKSSAACCVV